MERLSGFRKRVDERTKRSTVARAVATDWRALQFALAFREDPRIALLAARQDAQALRLASPALLDDAQFMIEAVRAHWEALEYAGPRVRANDVIAKE